ncbi:hypothetical protein SCLCIDRAFT_1216876 [Scleroderma citrinum Foug A]|uniref:Uncharacterized protein n=1 Tax=Scleroderma citrinum Foug A TaxID=1036808 RepID=A0A0C3DWZ5_9AGAM|nr:hypothetical protein SCLCIDRAFT_1216876 [Scleroderma citrinum Foug A]
MTTYDVPDAMQVCPEDGCTCALPLSVWVNTNELYRCVRWVDVSELLRDPKMYTDGFRSKARSAKSTTPVGTPKLPMRCEDDQSKGVHGPKQMIWNQLERTNIEVERGDLSGSQKSQAWVQFQVVQVPRTIFSSSAEGWYTSIDGTGLLSDLGFDLQSTPVGCFTEAIRSSWIYVIFPFSRPGAVADSHIPHAFTPSPFTFMVLCI